MARKSILVLVVSIFLVGVGVWAQTRRDPTAVTTAQLPTYVKGDIVRLVAPTTDPLPDSRVIALAGERIHIDRSGFVVNGEPVTDVAPQMLKQFAEPWDQVVPVGHYFVIGKRQEAPGAVRYHGLIPAEKIVRKVSK
jgi:type IV secretory pathway protease TraF